MYNKEMQVVVEGKKKLDDEEEEAQENMVRQQDEMKMCRSGLWHCLIPKIKEQLIAGMSAGQTRMNERKNTDDNSVSQI